MVGKLRIRNWEKFQHYKDRSPPWIKLHVEMLQSEDWVMVDDASKLLAVVCMMVGARDNGVIPNNADFIRRVANLNKKPNFKPLIECGFLEILQASDSVAQASAHICSPEERQSREDSVPDGTGAIAPINGSFHAFDGDWKKLLFTDCLTWLAEQSGKKRDSLRSLVGRWLALTGEDARAVVDVISAARAGRVADPISWITAHLGGKRDRNQPASVMQAIGRA